MKSVSLVAQATGICGTMFKISENMSAVLQAARRQREAMKIVNLREKRKVVIGGKVRKRRTGMKKTTHTMKTRRRKRMRKKVLSDSLIAFRCLSTCTDNKIESNQISA